MAYCLRLSYSGGLKTRNNHGLESLEHPAMVFGWETDMRGGHREKGSEVESQRSSSSGEFWQQRALYSVLTLPGEESIPSPDGLGEIKQ
jgi:hypothetical protein